MADDAARVEDTKTWLTKAEQDLKATASLLGMSPPLLGLAVFHAQQAAEKTLKGFLAWHGRTFRKTHNLTELGQSCVAIDPLLESSVGPGSRLTEYAWKFRYPGEARGRDCPEFR